MAPKWEFIYDAKTRPIIATAIHSGHLIRYGLQQYLNLSPPARIREEDPYTDLFTQFFSNRVIIHQSRFEYDLNRPRDKAIYRSPEDAWGLEVWQSNLPESVISHSLKEYDEFYSRMSDFMTTVCKRHKHFILLDIHSYNYRRHNITANPAENPDINIGTESIHPKWQGVSSSLMDFLQQQSYGNRQLDVRENVKFKGGHFPRWINQHFGDKGCAIAIEVKKIFMDELTNTPDMSMIKEIGRILSNSQNLLIHQLMRLA